MRIAVDAMGGDNAPAVELEGVVAAAREGADIVVVGDEGRVHEQLRRLEASQLPIEVRHASQVIGMDEHPSAAWRRKPDSSMRVCFELVKQNQAGALVSAGNSGAMLACGLFVLGRVEHIDRPAIVTTFPLPEGHCTVLDMGANVDLKPHNLAQFAVMGATYERVLHDQTRPRVGILSNGSEEHKGTELTRGAHKLLASAKIPLDFEYIGYVEGRDIFAGTVDVVVTDGFTGNVLLKTAEGVAGAFGRMLMATLVGGGTALRRLAAQAGALLLRRSFREMKRKLDWAEYGGAPLLGVQGAAIICHGASPPRAIRHAILNARHTIQAGLLRALHDTVARHKPIWETA
jgi:glycerol-3-phosphate acyltransferase PlsX